MAPRIFGLSSRSRPRSVSESHETPSRAIFNDLSDAHATITRRQPSNWATLTPGWANDQPLSVGNAKSTPLASVARSSNLIVNHSSETPHQRLRHPASPEIPESEIGNKFPSLSPQGSHFPASGSRGLRTEQHQSTAENSHRRSRSLDQLLNTPHLSTSKENVAHQLPQHVKGNLPQNSTVSDIYDSYIGEGIEDAQEPRNLPENGGAVGNEPMHGMSNYASQSQTQLSNFAWSPRGSLVDTETGMHTNIAPYVGSPVRSGGAERAHGHGHGHGMDYLDPIEASIAPTRDPEVSPHDSFDSFEAYINEVENGRDFEDEQRRLEAQCATVTLVSQPGPVRSRPMSQAEIMDLEHQIRRHLRSPSPLSNEYVGESNVDPNTAFGASRSSSSTSFGTFHLRRYGHTVEEAIRRAEPQIPYGGIETVRTRTGTPPLLFGSNAIPDSRVFPVASSEHDWETEDGVSRHNTQVTHVQGGVSSFADYSSSSSEMRARGLPPGGRVLQYPPHPRYLHTWNMMRDARTGQILFLPEDRAVTSQFPYQNALTSSAMRQQLFVDNHGAAMDSGSHIDAAQEPHYAVSEQASISGYDSDDNLQMITGSEEEGKPISAPKNQSSAWMSTDEGVTTEPNVNTRARDGSFAQVVIANQQANITGTPEGTGAREVGSSLADVSSPNPAFSSSPFDISSPALRYQNISNSEKKAHRRTIDGSLDTLKTQSSEELFKKLQGASIARSSVYSADEEFTALPQASSNLPPEIIEHRQQLIDHNLLPRPIAPHYQEPKRLSLPLDSLTPSKNKKATTATGANLSRHFQQFIPSAAILPTMRKRSPHRREPAMDHASTDFELEVTHPRRSKKSARGKEGRKRKVSDGEGSTALDNKNTAAPTERHIIEGQEDRVDIKTVSTEPVQLEPATVPTAATDSSSANGVDRNENDNHGTQRVDTPAMIPFRVDNEYKRSRLKNHEWDLLYTDLPGRESGTERIGRPLQRPRPRPAGPTQTNRPIARVRSPHLYAIPRTPEDNLLARQKELGRVILVLCILLPPLWLLFGHGYLDYMMDYLTYGACRGMRKEEKRVALFLGYSTIAAVVIGIPVGVVVGTAAL
ncbi:MAG: hypothetical protein Q9191_000048 [Dirinaria sp. TL-2023a]